VLQRRKPRAIRRPASHGAAFHRPQRACFPKRYKPLAERRSRRDRRLETHGLDSKVADDFKETEVGERYAQALFDLAVETGDVDAVRADLMALAEIGRESADFRRVLSSPAISSEDKGKALVAVSMKAKFNMTTLKFLGLLTENRRAEALPSVIASFRRLHDQQRGVVAAQVTTAVKLTPAQAKGVAKALAQALGREPEISTAVDPSILGGVKVRVGSRLFDASLKTKLDSLKFALKRA
jgi:F-type H+-transporting ATPase subunit delta